MHRTVARPIGLYLLLVCLLVIGFGGLYGGLVFLADPTGGLMGVTTELLRGFPIRNFTLPGLYLLIIMGLVPLVLALALWFRPSWLFAEGFQYLSHEHWAWTGTFLFSVLLLLWLGFQTLVIGFGAPAQLMTGILGVVLLVLCLLPSVKRYYHVP